MPADSLDFVVITGLSGAGKSYAIKCFEDMDFFCVDNLPTTLLPTFADLATRSSQKIHRVALGIDVRDGADLVFDVRFLANPHFVEGLRALDGRDPRVREFIFARQESQELLRRLRELLQFLLPCYEREGKAYLTVAIGCTGGRHRSVAFVEELRGFMESQGFTPTVVHRDLDRE